MSNERPYFSFVLFFGKQCKQIQNNIILRHQNQHRFAYTTVFFCEFYPLTIFNISFLKCIKNIKNRFYLRKTPQNERKFFEEELKSKIIYRLSLKNKKIETKNELNKDRKNKKTKTKESKRRTGYCLSKNFLIKYQKKCLEMFSHLVLQGIN